MKREPKRLVGEHFRSDGKPKRRFDTHAEAEALIELYGYIHLMIYGPCEMCGGYHLSKQRRRR
jgi:hypothetical protein